MPFKTYTKLLCRRKILFLLAKHDSLNISMRNFAPMVQVLYYFNIPKPLRVILNKSFKKNCVYCLPKY